MGKIGLYDSDERCSPLTSCFLSEFIFHDCYIIPMFVRVDMKGEYVYRIMKLPRYAYKIAEIKDKFMNT
jgi:hypothetical protein